MHSVKKNFPGSLCSNGWPWDPPYTIKDHQESLERLSGPALVAFRPFLLLPASYTDALPGHSHHLAIVLIKVTNWVWQDQKFFCFFFNFNFFNFYFYFILLCNTVLVLPYIDMNPPWVYMRSQTWTPLLTPSAQHPSGSSPCTSPKHAVSYIGHRLVIRFLW